jgi:hypothetical protein
MVLYLSILNLSCVTFTTANGGHYCRLFWTKKQPGVSRDSNIDLAALGNAKDVIGGSLPQHHASRYPPTQVCLNLTSDITLLHY